MGEDRNTRAFSRFLCDTSIQHFTRSFRDPRCVIKVIFEIIAKNFVSPAARLDPNEIGGSGEEAPSLKIFREGFPGQPRVSLGTSLAKSGLRSVIDPPCREC